MKVAYIFPGQGSQNLGMGKELYDSYEEVRKVYKKASEISGKDIANLSFNSSEEELSQIDNAQITIFTMSYAILELLKKENINAEYLAGLSLGEYTALTYANAFDFETAVKIVSARGKIMSENVPEGNWQMAGILGLSDSDVEKACSMVTKGFVVPANYNCPGQVVVSGDLEGIIEVTEAAKKLGAKKVSNIKTKGPFHTEKLELASKKLKEELDKNKISNPKKTVYKNINGEKYLENDDVSEILSRHIKSPVYFSKILQNMIDDGIDTFVEIGPGKVLSSLVKRVSKNVKILNINDMQSFENAVKILKEEENG